MSPIDYPARPERVGRRGDRRLVPPPERDAARCFVAVFPPESVIGALTDLRRQVAPVLPGLRWTAPGNLHFTLRFFGDLGRGDRERAAQVLDAVVPGRPVFPVELHGLGVFPNWRRPRVLWVGVGTGSAALMELARSLEHGFREAGLGQADKPFVAHLTLGRWRGEAAPPDPEMAARWSAQGNLGTFPVVEVGLIQSVLGPGGSSYTPLHTAALGAGGSA